MGGRPKSNIGMSWQKFSTDPEFGGGDKYDIMLQDAATKGPKQEGTARESIKQKNEVNNMIMKDIIRLNGPISWQNSIKNAICKCGLTVLKPQDKTLIKYSKGKMVKSMMVTGKRCSICGRLILVQKLAIDEYRKNQKI